MYVCAQQHLQPCRDLKDLFDAYIQNATFLSRFANIHISPDKGSVFYSEANKIKGSRDTQLKPLTAKPCKPLNLIKS